MAGEGAWDLGTEYKYELNSRTLAALPNLQDQWTGVITRGFVTIRPVNNNQLVGKIVAAEYATINDVLPKGWKTQFNSKDLKFQPMPIQNSKPFEIFLKKGGSINHLAVDRTTTNEEANQIKAIASLFQLDLQGDNEIKCDKNQFPQKDDMTGAYKVMERAVTGDCETLYDISPLPRYMLQSHPQWAPMPELNKEKNLIDVGKSTNYSNCDQRMAYHFGISGLTDAKPNTNQMGDFFTVSILYCRFAGKFFIIFFFIIRNQQQPALSYLEV